MKKIDNEKIKHMINMYQNGYTLTKISQELNISTSTISKYLKENNVYARNYMDRFNDSEIQELCTLYMDSNWDKIFEKYPFLDKNRVRHIASKMKVHKTTYFWSKEDIDYLINNFGSMSYSEMENHFNGRHTKKAISAKAIKLGLTSSADWSEDEVKILINNYSIISKNEILKLLPKRSEASIVCKATQLKIKSYTYLQNTYSEEEKQFIKNSSSYMSDIEISEILNKPLSGIQEQRRKLGIYHNHTDYSNYESLSKLFRANISAWKEQSMKNCNYKCILTESSDFEIHHLYGFNQILIETYRNAEEKNILKGYKISDYSEQELNELINLFKNIHDSYPLGVCIEKNIHRLFHKIYGSGGNTKQQWDYFVNNYKNKKYCNLLNIA